MPDPFENPAQASSYSVPPALAAEPDMDEELKRQIAALQQKYSTDALASTATPELSPTQAIAASVLKVAPMLLGMAVAKNRNIGISSGAEAGLASGGEYEKSALKEQQDKTTRSALLASQDLKDISTKEGERFQLGKDKLSDKRAQEMARQKGQIVDQDPNSPYAIDQKNQMGRAKAVGPKDVPPDNRLSDKQIEDVAPYVNAAQSAKQAIKTVKSLVPKLADSESYTKPDGSMDYEGAYNIISRASHGAVFGADTPEGQAQAAIQNTVAEAIKFFSGAASSEPEAARIAGFIQGKGLLPATFPAQIRLLEMYADRQKQAGLKHVQAQVELRSGNPIEGMNRLFDEDVSIAPPAGKRDANWAATQGYSPAEVVELQKRGLID